MWWQFEMQPVTPTQFLVVSGVYSTTTTRDLCHTGGLGLRPTNPGNSALDKRGVIILKDKNLGTPSSLTIVSCRAQSRWSRWMLRSSRRRLADESKGFFKGHSRIPIYENAFIFLGALQKEMDRLSYDCTDQLHLLCV